MFSIKKLIETGCVSKNACIEVSAEKSLISILDGIENGDVKDTGCIDMLQQKKQKVKECVIQTLDEWRK